MLYDVSVALPCFNAEDTIVRCLDSICAQTCQPREVVIVDDGSLIPIIKCIPDKFFQSEFKLIIISQHNQGAASARNRALETISSKYVAFLDADDIWHPQKIETQYAQMEMNSLAISGHHYVGIITENFYKHYLMEPKCQKLRLVRDVNFIISNPFFTPTVMINKFYFGGFDPNFRRVDDFKAWFETTRNGKSGFIDATLAGGFKLPLGGGGLTGSICLMHRSFIDVVRSLHNEKKIGFWFYFLMLIVEHIKFPLRYFRLFILRILYFKRYTDYN